MVNQLQLLGLFFAVLWYNISKGKKVRMISKHGFAGRFAPNIIKKGYDSIAVSCIRPYCMVKKNRQTLYKMHDNLLLRLCKFAVATRMGCVRLK